MVEAQSIEIPRRSIPFTIDGQPFTTDDISQRTEDLLKLAGLNPANYDLGNCWERITSRRGASRTTNWWRSTRTPGSCPFASPEMWPDE